MRPTQYAPAVRWRTFLSRTSAADGEGLPKMSSVLAEHWLTERPVKFGPVTTERCAPARSRASRRQLCENSD